MSRPAVLPWRSKKPMPRYSTLSSHPARYRILCAAISDVQAWLGLCKIVGQALSPPWGLGLAWLGLSPGLLGVNLNFVDSKLYIALKVVGMDILIRSRITWARLVTTIHFNCEIHSHCALLRDDDNRCSHQPQFLHILKNILNASTQHQRLKGRLVLLTDTFCICNICSHCCLRHTFWGEGGRTPSHLEYDLHTVLCCLQQWTTNWYPSKIHSGQWYWVIQYEYGVMFEWCCMINDENPKTTQLQTKVKNLLNYIHYLFIEKPRAWGLGLGFQTLKPGPQPQPDQGFGLAWLSLELSGQACTSLPTVTLD